MMDSAYLMLVYFENKKRNRTKSIVTTKSCSKTTKVEKKVKFNTNDLCKEVQE